MPPGILPSWKGSSPTTQGDYTLIVPLMVEQRRQLSAWLMREKDHIISMRALGRSILIPSVTGSLDIVSNDLEMVNRMRFALRKITEDPDFLEEDLQTVIEVAEKNKFEDKEQFWSEIRSIFREALKENVIAGLKEGAV